MFRRKKKIPVSDFCSRLRNHHSESRRRRLLRREVGQLSVAPSRHHRIPKPCKKAAVVDHEERRQEHRLMETEGAPALGAVRARVLRRHHTALSPVLSW